MSQALVSIIIPVKNVEPYIEECIDSILAQSYPHWELIVVNDHSTDNSGEIIQAYCKKDGRIRLLQNESFGIIPALQLAFQNISGEYITRMDGDDTMPSYRLRLMLDKLQSSEPNSVVTGKVAYFGDSISEGYQHYQKWINSLIDDQNHWENIYRECVIASPNWLARTEELKSIKAFTNLEYPEDYHLVFKWYENQFSIKSVDKLTLNWREHPKRTSRNSENYQQQAFFKLKLKQFLKNDYHCETLVIWGEGEKARLTASILEENEIVFEWMVLNPNKYPHGIQGHPVENFKKIEQLEKLKLLIAVYPTPKDTKAILNYLDKQKLQIGSDFWFL